MGARQLRFVTAIGLVLAMGAARPARGVVQIVGGQTVGIQEAPWQLLLYLDMGNGTRGNCGAVWIGGRWALTAAHCVEHSTAAQAQVYAGITKTTEANASNRLTVSRILVNPNWPASWQDIAILELNADVAAHLAKPIRYATAADVTAGSTNPGVACFATGWGGTNRQGDLSETLIGVNSKVKSVDKYMIFWAGQGGTANVGSCGGDSGGPVVVKDKSGAWILAGISSYITSYCGDPNSPAGYSRVSAFADWIKANTGDMAGISDGREIGPTPFFYAGAESFHLSEPLRLDMYILDLAGAFVLRAAGYYPAGEHRLPSGDLPAGAYLLRVDGEQLRYRSVMRITP